MKDEHKHGLVEAARMSEDRTSLLITAESAATMCSFSMRTWNRMDSAGKVPKPIYFGSRIKRWNREELERWIAAGCPSRREWDARNEKKSA